MIRYLHSDFLRTARRMYKKMEVLHIMAYRHSHYRRGYYRRTPSGGITWVSPTIVSGYEYEPGLINKDGHFSEFKYADNGNPFFPTEDNNQMTIIQEICRLFSKLDSENRKRCLDILESYDIQLDEEARKNLVPVRQSILNTSLFNISILEDNTLRIDQYLGIGNMNLNIPNTIQGMPITQINENAFKNSSDLHSISFPNSLQRIGNSAFSGCSKLSSLVLPSNLEWIGDNAFHYTGLEEVILPRYVNYLGESCFDSCHKLRTVNIQASVKRLPPYLFLDCENLKHVTISNGILEICHSAFSFSGIEGILRIPSSCTSIDFSAFKRHRLFGSKGLDLFIPSSVKKIYDSDNNYWGYGSYITIYCESGSAALAFAKSKGIPYKQYY